MEKETELTVSITGHQWYWNYEYSLDKLYFSNERAWEEFFVSYYALSNFKLGELEALPNIFNNLVLSEDEKEVLFGRIINCHSFMTIIDSTEDFDSYMIDENDLVNNGDFNYSSFSNRNLSPRK